MSMLTLFSVFVVVTVYEVDAIDAEQKNIAELERIIMEKDKIIFEQIQVITSLVEQLPKTYDEFSLEKFPDTGGYDPDWLEHEHDSILEACVSAINTGYTGLSYCKFVMD